jgi:hypothetical protein
LTFGTNKNYGDAIFVDYFGNVGVSGVLDGKLTISQMVGTSIRYDHPNISNIANCPSIVLDGYSIITVVCNLNSANPAPYLYSVNYCSSCTPGTYSNDNSDRCYDCPVGTYSTVLRLTSVSLCTQCTPGTYNNETGKQSCYSCPPGTYNDEYGATSIDGCKPCGPGRYSIASGVTSFSQCQLCPEGQYSSRIATDYCDPCPFKTFSSAGSTKCQACDAGTRYNSTSNRCESCDSTEFCPIASAWISSNSSANMSQLFTNQDDWADKQPDPSYLDVIRKWHLQLPYWRRPDTIINLIAICVGIAALVVVIILLLSFLLTTATFRKYLKKMDVFFQFKHVIEEGNSPIKKKTNSGAIMSVIAMVIICIVVFMNFGHFVIDNMFGMTNTEQKQSPDVKGPYNGSVAFYTFDSDPTHCEGMVRIAITGFGYSDRQPRSAVTWGGNLTSDKSACIASWSCDKNCTTTGSKSRISFELRYPGASAYAISYNFSSPYLLETEYDLIDGRVSSGSTNRVLRGYPNTIANLMAFYTVFNYSSPKLYNGPWTKSLQFSYFLPSFLMNKESSEGLTVTQTAHDIGNSVDRDTFPDTKDVVGIDLYLKFSPSIISIQSNIKTELFVWIGSLASNAGIILAVCGIIFPLVHGGANRVSKKLQDLNDRGVITSRLPQDDELTDQLLEENAQYHEVENPIN